MHDLTPAASSARYRRGDTIPALFAWCAERAPQATALVHGPVRLSYAELDARSDAHAAALTEAGVRPGDFVALVMPRTAETVAILLAILKCGAAYAALDPAWPRSRRAELIARVAPRLLVSPDPTWDLPRWHPETGAVQHRRREDRQR